LDNTIITSTQSSISGYKKSLLLVLCGVVAPLVLIASVIAGALVNPGYSHLTETISQLSSQDSLHPGLMTTGFITYGLLMIGLAFEFGRSLRPHRHARIVRILLIIHGIGLLLGGILRSDPTAVQVVRTPVGIMHTGSVFFGCLALVFGIFMFARIKSNKKEWRAFVKFSFVIISIVLFVFFMAQLPLADHINGLLQRLYVTPALLWVELVSIRYLL
jgi:hypothetical membrane protein